MESSTFIYNRVHDLHEERLSDYSFEDHFAKWDNLRAWVDKALNDLKVLSKATVEANREALRIWLAEVLLEIDMADLRYIANM